MLKLTNNYGLDLSVAVWLAHDEYDYSNDPTEISTTALIKPVKQIILGSRVEQKTADIHDRIQSSIGTAVHDSINNAWVKGYKSALLKLGWQKEAIDKIIINPTEVRLGDIPVYMEQRAKRKLNDWTVTGKYDFIADGILTDYKTTGTYTYVKQGKVDDYKLQGSIYRWLNPGIITNDSMVIQYIFTNWMAHLTKSENYPQARIVGQQIELLSLEETEEYLVGKLKQITELMTASEEDMPVCSNKDLWADPTYYAYYKNPTKTTGRSTKNYPTYAEANDRYISDGSVGTIMERTGQVKACAFCSAFEVCKQKDIYLADGSLII